VLDREYNLTILGGSANSIALSVSSQDLENYFPGGKIAVNSSKYNYRHT